MTILPSGSITYLFTDIEGSTRLWELYPDAMRSALAQHDEIIAKTVESHNGSVVRSRGEGDSIFAVFTSALDAITAACNIQLAFYSQNWPESTPIRVRMALNTGESELREDDYYGSAVNRCARLRGIAHGGQTVVSSETARLVMSSLPEGLSIKSLGTHRLRDVQEPEEVYQLVHPDLLSTFPRLRSLELSSEGRGEVFVGREHEMDELKAVLGDVLSSRGRIAMLVGEPGIGKTRTAHELAEIAIEQGVEVLWGRCYEEQGVPPYWPWVQAIRSHIQQTDAERLRSEMGVDAANVADLIPELRDRFPDLGPFAQLDPEQARFRLFNAITNLLKNVSHSHPLALILEDLHWADASSLQLLEFVGRELGENHILLLGTYRDVEVSRRHPLSQTLGGLMRESVSGVFHRVQLRGLSQQDVGHFVEAATGAEQTPNVVRAVHSRTEGNPLFLGEIARMLAQEGPQSRLNLPEGIRDAIGRRLDRLSDECNEVLTIASVVGRGFSFGVISRLNQELSEVRLLDVLDEALEARVIEEVPESPESYQFAHALIQETLLSELSAARQVRLHARIAEALEEIYDGSLESHASELAYHFAEASPILGSDKLVRYSLMAGEQALAAYAWEDARRHFELALEAKDKQAIDDEKAAALFGMARAQLADLAPGEVPQVVSELTEAFEYYAAAGDVSRAIAAVEYHHNAHVNILMRDSLAKAIELVPENSLQLARLLCSYGLSNGARGNGYAQGQAALKESLSIARREGDVILERRIMAGLAMLHGRHMKWEQCLKKSLSALELSSIADDPNDRLRAYTWLCNSLTITGETKSAEKHVSEMYTAAETLRNVSWLGLALWHKHLLAYLSGQWEDLYVLGDRNTNDLSNVVAALALYQTGDFDKGNSYMNAVTEGVIRIDTSNATWSIAAACSNYIRGETGLQTEVENVARDALADPELAPNFASLAQSALALIAVLQNDASSAAEQYANLKPYAHLVTQVGALSFDRLLGLLCHTTGNTNYARSHFEDALAFCRKAGYRPELAWTCYDYANMLAESGMSRPDSQADAGGLIDEGLSIAVELGMKPLVEKLTTLKERMAYTPSKPSYPKGLTEREVEVLRLAAQGKTNREIAAELFISTRTVQNHIRNIYNKIDARNRVEATAFAINNLGPLQ